MLQVKELKTRMEVLGKTDERLGMIENFNTRLGVFNDAVTEMENWIGDARYGIKDDFQYKLILKIVCRILVTRLPIPEGVTITAHDCILFFASEAASMSSSSLQARRPHTRRRTGSRGPWKYRRTS